MPLPTKPGSVIQGRFQPGSRPQFARISENRQAGTPPPSHGQPMPAVVQRTMENLFKASFNGVRIHVGASAASIGALAYTHGSDIHFAPGQYDPYSARGVQLLAHELAHVVQQRSGRVRSPFSGGLVVVNDGALENEADRMGRLAARAAAAPCRFPAVQPKSAIAVIQRMQVSLAVEETTQKHHPNYKFTTGIGPGAQTHNVDLDPWITRSSRGYDQKFVERSQKKAIGKLIAAWTCKQTIVDDLLPFLVGTVTGGSYTYNASLRSYVGEDLARHLVALQENIKRRERDIPANCYDVDLEIVDKLGKKSTVRKTIGWTTLLKEARALLKKELLARKECPAVMGSVTLLKTAVQNTTDGPIQELRRLELLDDEMALETRTRNHDGIKYTAAGTGIGAFNFGYGHLRFILFLEWRICSEVWLGQTVK
jgi:hypothetical protein